MSITCAARNPAMPGLIEIGRTDQEADARLLQLYTVGVPVPFKCVMAVKPERSATEVEHALNLAFWRAGSNVEGWEKSWRKQIDPDACGSG